MQKFEFEKLCKPYQRHILLECLMMEYEDIRKIIDRQALPGLTVNGNHMKTIRQGIEEIFSQMSPEEQRAFTDYRTGNINGYTKWFWEMVSQCEYTENIVFESLMSNPKWQRYYQILQFQMSNPESSIADAELIHNYMIKEFPDWSHSVEDIRKHLEKLELRKEIPQPFSLNI